MGKKSRALPNRAWNLLRMALYWARKGGIFKRRLMSDLLPNYLRTRHSSTHRPITPYGEREFSFNDTPIFNLKVQRPSSLRFRHLPRIPCINPPLGFDDYDRDHHEEERNFFRSCEEEDYGCGADGLNEDGEEGEDGIDNKAAEFIARFYEQMKLQRQVSYLQYKEMLQRGTD